MNLIMKISVSLLSFFPSLISKYVKTYKAITEAQMRVKERTKAEFVDAGIHNNTDLRFKIINTPLVNLPPAEKHDSAKAIARFAKDILNTTMPAMTDSYNKIHILIHTGKKIGQKDGFAITPSDGEEFSFVLKDL